ncbi:MAG: hypothetical protein AABX10_02750 [Nanoarchaeota archaeon]
MNRTIDSIYVEFNSSSLTIDPEARLSLPVVVRAISYEHESPPQYKGDREKVRSVSCISHIFRMLSRFG